MLSGLGVALPRLAAGRPGDMGLGADCAELHHGRNLAKGHRGGVGLPFNRNGAQLLPPCAAPALAEAAGRDLDVIFHLAAIHDVRGCVDLHQAECAKNLMLDGGRAWRREPRCHRDDRCAFIDQDPFEVWGDGTQIRNWKYVGMLCGIWSWLQNVSLTALPST